jgi:hypothetical protein
LAFEHYSYAIKKKRNAMRYELVLFDFSPLGELLDELSEKSIPDMERDKKGGVRLATHQLYVDLNQVHFIQASLAGILNERNRKKDPDLKEPYYTEIQDFLKRLSSYSAILRTREIIDECIDFSCLCFREFHMELLKRNNVWIPLPNFRCHVWQQYLACWRSTFSQQMNLSFRRIIPRRLIFRALYLPLKIYEAAEKKCRSLKCQYIYDEMKAEVYQVSLF